MGGISDIRQKIENYRFVFEELVKRDFKKKYERSVLGILWSLLSPLLTLLVMSLIFGNFFGRNTPHYTIYLFSGIVVMTYYSQATNSGMKAFVNNAGIFSKVKVPKYLFLLANVMAFSFNFLLTLVLYFFFVAVDGLPFRAEFLLLVFPLGCLSLTVVGVSMLLAVLNVFFRDIEYLYGIFLTMLTYCTPIFYKPEILGDRQWIFYGNPLFLFINYIREIVIYGRIPGGLYHAACLAVALGFLLAGYVMYRRYNRKFLYYV